jgi:hypothetical protein
MLYHNGRKGKMAAPDANLISVQKHRPYEAQLFVNRQDEIRAIHDRIRLAQSAQAVSESVINYWGVGGIGKTWILQHLNDKFSYQSPTEEKRPSFTVFFEFQKTAEANVIEQFAQGLARRILDQLSAHISQSVRRRLEAIQTSSNLEELANVILGLSKDFTPLILLDNAENISPDLWDEIERQFFEPLVSTGKVLVVVAGRRQVPRWRRFEVRRRAMDSEKSQIKPFDKQGVLKQLERLNVSITTDLLYPYTAGNPHIVDIFVRYIQSLTESSENIVIDKQWVSKHNQDLLRVLQLSKEELIKDVPKRLRQILLAVAPLRFYRLEAMRYMLGKQNSDVQREPDSHILQFLRDLDQETEIVWWDRGHRAYVTSEVVRKLIDRANYIQDAQAYITSHNHAITMYWDWAKDSPKTSDEFIIEILFHEASICEVSNDLICLQSKFVEVLDFARDNLGSERLLVFQKQIEGDSELLDLLPEKLRGEIVHRLEDLLNSRA